MTNQEFINYQEGLKNGHEFFNDCYEQLESITCKYNNLKKGSFVSESDFWKSLGLAHHNKDRDDCGLCKDKNGKWGYCVRVYNTPAFRKIFRDKIVHKDQMYIYVSTDETFNIY